MTQLNSHDPALQGELGRVDLTKKQIADIESDNAARLRNWLPRAAKEKRSEWEKSAGQAPDSLGDAIRNIIALPPVYTLPSSVDHQYDYDERNPEFSRGPTLEMRDMRALVGVNLPLPEAKFDDPVYGEISRGSMDLSSFEYGKDIPHILLEGGVGLLSEATGVKGLVDFAKTLSMGLAGVSASDGVREVSTELDALQSSAQKTDGFTRLLGVGVSDLDSGVNELGGGLQITSDSMDDMNTSMVAGGQGALALAGDLETLEEQARATRDAFNRGVAAPWAPTQSGASAGGWGPPAGGGADADLTRPDSIKEARARFLASPPPANLQAIYLDQFRQGHDMSGFRDARHWWGEHLKHMARLKYGYAQGTSFAPGGMALVGEMGPELVNLPRGSQVIPDPRLGSEVTVNVNVEGSVVAERDLAQRIRQELIRTSRRTVDLGFVA